LSCLYKCFLYIDNSLLESGSAEVLPHCHQGGVSLHGQSFTLSAGLVIVIPCVMIN